MFKYIITESLQNDSDLIWDGQLLEDDVVLYTASGKTPADAINKINWKVFQNS